MNERVSMKQVNQPSIVNFDMPVLLGASHMSFHSAILLVAAVYSSKCQIRVAEENGSQQHTAYEAILKRSDDEEGPIEVMVLPVSLEKDSVFDDALFLCCI